MLNKAQMKVYEEPKLIDLQDNSPAHGECKNGSIDALGCATGGIAQYDCTAGTALNGTTIPTTTTVGGQGNCAGPGSGV